MNRPASVASIHIAPVKRGATSSVAAAEAVAGQGLRGDRYWIEADARRRGSRASSLTLIELEAVTALQRELGIDIEPGAIRRNVVTSGVALNHLVGKRFRVGPVELLGLSLCEPCLHLEKLTRRGVLAGLVHRGGLRAEIISGGTITAGDPVVVP